MPRRRVKKEPQSRPRACIACPDSAAGYNYGGPSCANCKTFFRRAVIEKRDYQGCLRYGACDKDETVRPCRSCRYDRCIKGGMQPSLVSGSEFAEGTKDGKTSIDSETPSTSFFTAGPRRRKVLSKSSSVESQTEIVHNDLPEDIPCDPEILEDVCQEVCIVSNPHQFESKLEKMMQNLLILEDAHQKLRISSYTPKIMPGLTIDDFVAGPSRLGVDFGPMHSQPYELISIQIVPVEVLIKRRYCTDLSNFDYSSKKLWLFQDKIYSIEFIKALPIYNLLDECSKKVLIASGITCANFTAAYYSYMHHSDRTCYPDGSVMTWNSEMVKESPGSTRLYTGMIAAMKEAELDTREYALLKSIIICNPLLDGLAPYDVTLLQHEKERCTKTLLSYVLARRGVDKGPAYFAKILSIADVTNSLTSWQKSQCIVMLAMGLYKNNNPFTETMYHSH